MPRSAADAVGECARAIQRTCEGVGVAACPDCGSALRRLGPRVTQPKFETEFLGHRRWQRHGAIRVRRNQLRTLLLSHDDAEHLAGAQGEAWLPAATTARWTAATRGRTGPDSEGASPREHEVRSHRIVPLVGSEGGGEPPDAHLVQNEAFCAQLWRKLRREKLMITSSPSRVDGLGSKLADVGSIHSMSSTRYRCQPVV